MLTASVENMLVTSIDTTLETGVVPTQYIVIISTVRRQSEVGIQRWIDVGPIVNFCLGTQVVMITIEMVKLTTKIAVLTNKKAEAYFTNRSSWFY